MQLSVPKAKYLTEIITLFSLFQTQQLHFLWHTSQHHPVVCLGTAPWKGRGEGGWKCSEGFILWIWCEWEIKWNWYLATFKCVAFGQFQANFVRMKCIRNEAKFLHNFVELFTVVVQREYIIHFYQKRERDSELINNILNNSTFIHCSWKKWSCV